MIMIRFSFLDMKVQGVVVLPLLGGYKKGIKQYSEGRKREGGRTIFCSCCAPPPLFKFLSFPHFRLSVAKARSTKRHMHPVAITDAIFVLFSSIFSDFDGAAICEETFRRKQTADIYLHHQPSRRRHHYAGCE